MSDCVGPINIIPDNNQVILLDNNKSITVIDNNCCTNVDVTQPVTSVIQVLTGPQGAAGTNGADGLSAPFTYVGGNVWNTTSSIEITGSFTVSGSNTFKNIGPAQFTGSVDILGTLVVTNGITGSLHGTASWAENTNTASGILGGKATHIPFFTTDTTLATSSLYQSGSDTIIINQDNATSANPEALYVWQPSTTSFNVISGKGNLNNYLQLNIQNTNQGDNASSDVVATANNGSENNNYIDMGINSENFAGFLGGPNDSYLYTHGHNFWIGNINDGYNTYFFNSSSLLPIITLNATSALITGSLLGTASYALTASYAANVPATASYATTASYALTASYAANVPATASYAISASHANNADNAINANYATTAGNGGVTQLVAGAGITLVPAGGQGAVTIISSGGGGVTIISGSLITGSFINTTSYTFNHNLSTRTPIITVFDSNYNQIIPQNIQLIDTASAIITFPTQESGFVIGSTGGTTGTALSSSYALFSTYATTASYYTETDPVFIAKSGSFTTTSSFNSFTSSYKQDSSSFSSSISSLTSTTSSYVLNSQTSSMTVLSASFASTASYIKNAQTASYVLNAVSSSYALNADLLDGKDSTIFATTGSNVFVGNQTITGSLNVSGSNTLIGTKTITGSVFITGSKTVIGTNTITGSLNVSGSQTFNGISISIGSKIVTGSLLTSGSQTLIGNTTLSGSINISGSQIFNGTSAFYGSHTLSGSNTITGNTILSGSLEVSGSTILHNSIFVVTGSTFIKGTTQISGSTGITGSLEVRDGDINIVSGSSFTRWGHKLFNYGAFSDSTTQSGSANTAYAAKFNTTDLALNINLSGSSNMKIDNTGIYNFQWSGQLNQGAGAAVVSIWLKVNGNDVPGSRGDVTLASNTEALPAWNYVLLFNANDAIELYWSSNSANTSWVSFPTGSAPSRPSAASFIATITQIA